MRTLKPIIEKSRYYKPIESVLLDFLMTLIFVPIFEIIEPIKEYYNESEASESLIISAAIRSGQIQYFNGRFSGDLTANISKALRTLGAKFNKVTKSYHLLREALPMNILESIAFASVLAQQRNLLILKALDSIKLEKSMPQLQNLLDVPLDYVLEDLSVQAQLTLQSSISIVPKIDEETRAQLKSQYVDDITTAIGNFAEKQTEKLRALVEENTFTGLGDNKTLVNEIIKEFGVTERKAHFLARQETSLFIANYRKITYQKAGIISYKWSTSHDDRVRKMHTELDGKIFYFDNPPVTNDKGETNNPGEDFNCRCVPIPVFD